MTPAELYAQHSALADRVARQFFRFVPAHHDREDLIAEAHHALWQVCHVFDPAKSPGGYAQFGPFAVQRVRWLLIRHTRYLPPAIATLDERHPGNGLLLHDPIDPRGDPKDAVDVRDTVTDLLYFLSPRQRQVMIRLADGQSFATVGAAMGVTKTRVQQIQQEALTVLRKCLSCRNKERPHHDNMCPDKAPRSRLGRHPVPAGA